MDNKTKKNNDDLKHGESCADAVEVREAMLSAAMGDGEDDYDVVNPNLGQGGQLKGSHNVNINQQTDLELGALADPGGLDPASDRQFLKSMKENINRIEKTDH